MHNTNGLDNSIHHVETNLDEGPNVATPSPSDESERQIPVETSQFMLNTCDDTRKVKRGKFNIDNLPKSSKKFG